MILAFFSITSVGMTNVTRINSKLLASKFDGPLMDFLQAMDVNIVRICNSGFHHIQYL